MGFIRSALIGAAVYAAVQHITKKDVLTGRSILDDLLERAPEFIDKAKIYAREVEIKLDSPRDVIATENPNFSEGDRLF